MQFESLPNELLFNLFEFFDTIQLLRAFFGLNSRLNQLIVSHFQNHQFNIRSISKDDFDIICQQYLPLILDHITSLYLSNEETPDLFELLLSHGFVFDRFIRLQSLSLHYIDCLDTLSKIIRQCRHLRHLTYLNIVQCNIEERQKRIIDLFNNIWSIPKLTHCNLNGIQLKLISLSSISSVSSSIKHLFIENIPCDLNCLSHLIKYTPRLQQLSTTIYSYSTDENLKFLIPSITSLKIIFQGSVDSIKNIFLHMPNLYHLTIEILDIYLDGYTWEQMITNYLSKLKIFQLKMKFELLEDDNDVEENIDQLLIAFRTKFWIKEHQWYVRCHWGSSEITTYITLYTLPFAFNAIHYLNECHTKSTCIDEREYWTCKHVQIFEDNYRKSLLFDNFNLICAQFPNLRCLDIVLPFLEDFNSNNVILNHLNSLSVTIRNTSAYSQLQTLFDCAPRLYSLKIISGPTLSVKLFQLISKSIRRLDFIGKQLNWWNQFTKEECIALSDSKLGCQCEILSIKIKDRSSIIDLIQRMSNLRLLNFRCKYDMENPSTEYGLIHWVQNHFPSSYTVITNPEKSSCIQVWIDRQDKISKRHASISKHGYKVSQFLTSIQRFFSRRQEYEDIYLLK